MTLRKKLGDHSRRAAPRPSGLRLLGACALAAVLLGLFAGSSAATVADYSGTLYLSNSASAVGSGNWQIVTSAPSSSNNGTQNRVNLNTTGYAAFAPGVSPGAFANSSVTASISVSSCTGWIVDGTGGMTFPAGTWTFQAVVEDPVNANGQAHLTAALYKVDASGNVVSTIVSPTDGGSNLVRSAGAVTTTESISSAASSFSLSSSQHLCLMFWRHQTPAYTSGGTTNRLFKLDVNDGTASISAHPTPDGFPSVSLSAAPADGAYVNASQTLALGVAYSDPESEAGTVVTDVCQNAGCSPVYLSNTANAVASGTTSSWSPSLPDGTYYWRGSATDTVGGSATSATHSFTLNTTVPSVPALVSPANGVTTNALGLTATFSDPSVADTGTVDFRLCSDAACASVVASGSSSSVTNGANGSWTITPAPADGLYYWQARNDDLAGNLSAWSAARTVTFDRTAPTTTIGSKPAAASTSSSATFGFSATETATFECNLDGAGWGTSCTSPTAYSGLADGSHSFQVRATDTVGNVGSAASWSWTIDTTVPATPTLTAPADGILTNTIPQLGGTFTDPTAGDTGTVQFRICTNGAAAGSQCNPLVTSGNSATVTTPATGTWTPSSLADGTYDWQARAVDSAGNASGWTATRSFTLDTTPPDTSITSNPATASNSTTPSFSFSSTESPSTFECSLDGAAYASCTSPASYTLPQGPHTFAVRATDSATNTDPSPATYSWTIDTTPPDTSIVTQPPATNPSASATFDFSATESATFECERDAGPWTPCSTPKTYSALSEGNHTFQVRATDTAGNLDSTPASAAWFADTTVPSSAFVSPSAGVSTNAIPQLRATFTDPTASDSGTVEFRICSAAASGGVACAPMLQDVTSATMGSGSTASYTPAALGDGQYYWQTRAQDAAGNLSAWSSTRAFALDTVVPNVPVLTSPAQGVWVNKATLSAQFNDPGFGSSGTVEFRACSDAACLGVGSSGTSGTVSSGSVTSATLTGLSDGYWWWQARAHDAAGNVSAWSSTLGVGVDGTPPAAPSHFNGQLGGDGLTLRWDPPADWIANFVVYVDGASLPYLGATTYEYKVGPFDASDTREFSVLAVDKAGNLGAMSDVLVGVPNLVGLTVAQADAAARARGLTIRRDASVKRAGPGVVVAQDPSPASLQTKGGAVKIVVKQIGAAPLVIGASPSRVGCAPGSVLKLRVTLSRAAVVRARILGARGRVLATRGLGLLHAGNNSVAVKLPPRYRGNVRVVLDSAGSSVRAVVRVAHRSGRCVRV